MKLEERFWEPPDGQARLSTRITAPGRVSLPEADLVGLQGQPGRWFIGGFGHSFKSSPGECSI